MASTLPKTVAYGIELDIPIVIDDQDMSALADAFDAKVMPTLELQKIMLDCDHSLVKKSKMKIG